MVTCQRCDGNGAVTVHYHSGEPFDLGICTCAAADILRRLFAKSPEILAARYGVPVERIELLDDILEAASRPELVSSGDDMLINAGKIIKAGLGGKVIR